jgi:TonB-dependent receptor
MKIRLLKKALFLLLLCGSIGISAQTGIVEGTITDAKTKETLVGASILVQGTSTGTITDLDGKYSLQGLTSGNYNLIISYISYDQQIQKVQVVSNASILLNVALEPASLSLESVKVSAVRRTGTELSLISNIKAGNVVANGISGQQISKSQDKDAAEVIKRVPGITVVDDKFVVIRGLSERYNNVLLNNSPAPSSESDAKAFSFDLIPSNMIDNMVIYKSPSPDLPADFAGGLVKISTKNNADENKFSISYGSSWNQSVTFKNYYSYKGSPTDWLGFDNGLRDIPAGFPDTKDFAVLTNNTGKNPEQIAADKETITNLGRKFSKIWTANPAVKASPDQKMAIVLTHRFVVGPVSIGTINSLNYSNTKDLEKLSRVEYPGTYGNSIDTTFRFINSEYTGTAKVGAISNWSVIFGKNQKIEFRNMFNQIGVSKYVSRAGRNKADGNEIMSNELSYKSRSIYSGQLSGQFMFNRDRTKLDFTLGSSFASQNQPDDRRITYIKNDDSPELGYYLATSNGTISPENLGRVYQYNRENMDGFSLNISEQFSFLGIRPELMTGLYLEKRQRKFRARNLGFIESSYNFDWRNRFLPLDTALMDENISFPKGFKIGDGTSSSDLYDASNNLLALYLRLDIPVFKFLNLNGGLRIEKNKQVLLSGWDKIKSAKIDTLNFFPSINASINLSKKIMLRLGYGLTINRPEFREIAPYSFYDFEEKESSYGYPGLKNAYITNYDFRVEWYPNNYDMITLAAFYKEFKDPIEKYLFPAGSNRNFHFGNVENASSKGLEIDMPKSLINLSTGNFLLHYLSHYSLLFNAALIDSRTVSDLPQARERVRPMLGQSPYIINAGIFYQNDSSGLMISLLYNKIGKRIIYVGDKSIPHIWEMPRNSLDLTITKTFNAHLALKAGIVDILAEAKKYSSFLDVTKPESNGEVSKGTYELVTKSYTPGRLFNLSLTYQF